jgi:hypothetical protein
MMTERQAAFRADYHTRISPRYEMLGSGMTHEQFRLARAAAFACAERIPYDPFRRWKSQAHREPWLPRRLIR